MPRWRGDGRELFFLDLQRQIMSASLTTDKKVTSIVRVTKGTPIDEGGGFDVARDGSRLVAILSPRDLPPPSLTVVLNWETLLK